MGETLSVLFTDAVASTEALVRLGDERFEAVQAAHLGLLRAAAGAHGGREVKGLGDGVMVVFTGAADALGCAVAMQQAVEAAARRDEESLGLRVGVSSGDVSVAEDGEVNGTAVVEAARLCAAAGAGQILASELARGLAGSRGGHAFTALGLVALKGFSQPVAVVEVGWAPLAEGDGLASVPLPPSLAAESAWAFVGRSRELEHLSGVWRRVVGGGRAVALLGGEPGAGKTRLAREFAVRTHREGALVLFGRVDEDLAVAYQPFAEALRHYLASVDDATRGRVLALRGGVLARLVPDMVEEPLDGQVEAWAVFEALADWLSGEAERRPVVLVLDDLQWAARPTLGALVHLARNERLRRLLVVGTYRDTELDRTHPLAATLADLRREEGMERLSIRGLDSDGVGAFLQAARGDVLDEEERELAAMVSEHTQGNPFFVTQVLRHLIETGSVEERDGRWVRAEGADVFVVPEGVREVIGRRVRRLSPRTGDLLRVAAVAGAEFETSIVTEVASQRVGEALDSFDEAVGWRLLMETNVPGRLRFGHALVRQTLEDELTTLRRLHLHRDIALAIERRFGDADNVVAELAHHFAAAAAVGEGQRAAHYTGRAAMQATQRGAPAQGADLLDRALDLLGADVDRDGLLRDRLYAQLTFCCDALFDLPRLDEASSRWLALGRVLHDDIMRVNAAVWPIWSLLFRQVHEPDDTDAIAEALRVDLWSLDFAGRHRLSLRGTWCEMDAPGLRAWLLANAAAGWALGLPLEGIGADLPAGNPQALAEEAVRVAADSKDPEIAGEALYFSGWSLFGTPDAFAQLEAGERAVRTRYRLAGGAWTHKGIALARLGHLDDLRVWTDEMVLTAEQRGDRILAGFARIERAMEALARGRFDEARSATEQVLEILPDQPSTQWSHATLTVARLLSVGRAPEARPMADLLASKLALDTSDLVGAVAVAQGDLDTARTVLDAWRVAEYQLPADFTRSARLWGLAECAHAVGDREAAHRLYKQLSPYNGQLLVYAVHFIPASAAFTLGQLAETLSERDRALTHYTHALGFEERIRAQTLAARTRDALERIRARP